MLKNSKETYFTSVLIFLSLAGCGGGSGGGDDNNNANTQRKTSLTISWQANTDADLNGYYIYHGSMSSSLTDKHLVSKEATSYAYQVKSSDSTDHYFAISAVDKAGNESIRSEVIYVDDRVTL